MNAPQPFGEELSSESLGPLLENQTLVVMGGGKGDEGKGGDAYAMSVHGKYEYIVGAVGGPNAGHTVHTNLGEKFVGHNLPGAALSGKPVFLGQAKFINISGLEKEALEVKKITHQKPKILIANSAHVILNSFHKALDIGIENMRSDQVGTTGSGMGPVVATRGLRTGINFAQLFALDDTGIRKMAHELIAPWSSDFNLKIEDIIAEIKQEKTKLNELIEAGVVQLIADDFIQRAHIGGDKILIEGAQSPSLGMFGGAYPNNTSTDTSLMGILSSLGIRPVPGKVAELLVVKAFPSAVGTHIFPERVSHVFPEWLGREEEFADDTGESGATTGRRRKVAFPSPGLVYQQLETGAPYTRGLSVRKLDVVPRFSEIVMKGEPIPVVTGYERDGTPILSTRVADARELAEFYKAAIAQALGNDKIILMGGFGPAPKESRVIQR